jgi:hypothetical protein
LEFEINKKLYSPPKKNECLNTSNTRFKKKNQVREKRILEREVIAIIGGSGKNLIG